MAGPNGPAGSTLRIGIVVASPAPTAQICWIDFGDGSAPLDVPFAGGYIPVAGDVVSVLFSSSPTGSMRGLVLGGQATQSGNMVINGNFYRAPILTFPPVNAPPYHWNRYVASGTAAVFAQFFHPSKMRFIGNVNFAPGGAASSDTFIYSSAIPVEPGRQYIATAAGHSSTFVLTTLTVQSRVAWFTDAQADYPNFASETQYGSDTYGANLENDPYHTGTVTAPAGALFARMVMRNSFTVTGAGGGGNSMWAEIVLLPA